MPGENVLGGVELRRGRYLFLTWPDGHLPSYGESRRARQARWRRRSL